MPKISNEDRGKSTVLEGKCNRVPVKSLECEENPVECKSYQLEYLGNTGIPKKLCWKVKKISWNAGEILCNASEIYWNSSEIHSYKNLNFQKNLL